MLSCCLGQACGCCAGQTLHAFGRAVPVNYPRVMHVLIFGVTALGAWLCGMYLPAEVLERAGIFGACAAAERGAYDVRACFVSLFVVRAMAALAVWYGVLALLTVHVREPTDWRVRIYAELWGPKVLALVALVAVAFVLPNDVFVGYSWLALVGAAAFVLVQIVVLIDFACEWAAAWVAHMEDEADEYADGCGAAGCRNGYFVTLLATSAAMFAGALAIVVALYCLFTRAHVPGGCSGGALNAFLITVQLVLSVVCAVCAVLPAVKERTPDSGLLQASFVALYTAYLLLSALLSEPNSWKDGCNRWYTDTPGSTGGDSTSGTAFPWYRGTSAGERVTAVLGAVITVVAVCYSTFRTSASTDKLVIDDGIGSNRTSVVATVVDGDDESSSSSSSSDKDKNQDSGNSGSSGNKGGAQRVPFSFALFHTAFMLGAMYVQQLLTNWETLSAHDAQSSAAAPAVTVDSGAGSVWAKIVSSWLVFALYLWSLFAPLLFPDRDFGYGVSYSF